MPSVCQTLRKALRHCVLSRLGKSPSTSPLHPPRHALTVPTTRRCGLHRLPHYPARSPLALPETGIRFMTNATQSAVWAPITEHNRHRHVGTYVCLPSHPQLLRRVLPPGVGDHVRQPTVEHPLAVGLIEWDAFAFSPAEGSRIPLQRAEDQLVCGELRDEGDVHPQVLPDQGEQAHYRLRRLV